MNGIYALLDVGGCVAPRDALAVFDLLVEGGIQTIQIRGKTLLDRDLFDVARGIIERRPPNVRVLVNDRADIAKLAGADGVHVGQSDLSPTDLRPWCPSPFIIGLSCHTLDDAVRAHASSVESNLVDYIGFGPVFETSTKARPSPTVGLAKLREVVERVHPLPVVAIGGITVERIPAVWETGAAAIAMASGLTSFTTPTTDPPGPEAKAESIRSRIRRATESIQSSARSTAEGITALR
ncbi:MAG: thiamine phosphate synthase [Deltaproteobacteria bacterium]|nr:thiamine phosphate synthase [Deltaproteobacteria bacterium]